MTYCVVRTSRFKKDYKLMQRRGAPMEELHAVIDLLRQGKNRCGVGRDEFRANGSRPQDS